MKPAVPTASTPIDPGGSSAHPRVAPSLRGRHVNHRWGEFFRVATPLVLAIVGLSLYTNAKDSNFISSNNIQNILVQSSVLGILGVGQLLLLVGGQLDLSVGSMVSFTGVLGAYQLLHGWGEWPVVATVLVVGAAVGLVWGIMVTFLRVPAFILTLGGLSVFASLALIVSNNQPIPVTNAFNQLGFGSFLGLRIPILLWALVLIMGIVLLHFTRMGKQVVAIGSSEQTAFLSGIPVRGVKVAIFALNGTLAGLAGLLLMARLSAGDPVGGSRLELAVIAAAVLGGASLSGGKGTMIGAALGVLTFGVINSSLTFLNLGGSYQSLVSGGVLILAVSITAVSEHRRSRVREGPSYLDGVFRKLLGRPSDLKALRDGEAARGSDSTDRPESSVDTPCEPGPVQNTGGLVR
ncbi:MAG: ABC transporter permease [Acidimicrobiales bacterium]